MFPEKPGVMAAREFTAEDVLHSFNRLDKSPKKIAGYFDHLAKVHAPDWHTVVFEFMWSSTPNGITVSAGATTRA
jgi:peptide/nickel transport system substrate-binding protein